MMNALAKRIDILSQVEDVPWLERLGRMFEKEVKRSTLTTDSPDKIWPEKFGQIARNK